MFWYTRAQFPLEVYLYEVHVAPTSMPLLDVNILASRQCRALKFSTHTYEDHKLPSVTTRDLEHAGHDSYLAL